MSRCWGDTNCTWEGICWKWTSNTFSNLSQHHGYVSQWLLILRLGQGNKTSDSTVTAFVVSRWMSPNTVVLYSLDGQTPTLCRSSRARGLQWSSRRPAACFLLSSSTLPVHSMHQQGRGRALWLARGTALSCDYGLGAHGGPCHVDTSTGLLAKYQRDLCKGKEQQRHPGEILSFLLTTFRTSKSSLNYNTITHSVQVVQEFSNTICKNLCASKPH